MGNVQQHVIKRLLEIGLTPPSRIGPEMVDNFYNEYIDSLSAFPDDVLVKAVDDIRTSCQFWPTIAEVYAACKRYTPPAEHQSSNWDEVATERPTPEQIANVRRMAEIFRKSVKPIVSRGRDVTESLKGTPYENIFKNDRKTFYEKEKRYRLAEKE